MSKEKLKPLRNHGSWIRRVFDLQVASTYRGILPIVRRVTSDRTSGKVVDVGCGDRPYRTLFPSTWEYLGIDTQDAETNIDYKDAEVIYYDGVTFPIDNESVDFVFHSEVIEHIYDTRYFLSECSRGC